LSGVLPKRAIKGEELSGSAKEATPLAFSAPGPLIDISTVADRYSIHRSIIMDQFDLNLDPRAYFMGDPFLSGDNDDLMMPDPHLGSMLDSFTDNYNFGGLDDEIPMFKDDEKSVDELADGWLGQLDVMHEQDVVNSLNEEHAYAASSSPDESDRGSGLSLSPACSSSPSESYGGHVDILRAASESSGIYSYDTGFESTTTNTTSQPHHAAPPAHKHTTFVPAFSRQSSQLGSSRRTIVKGAAAHGSQSAARNGGAASGSSSSNFVRF
ncbi:hypothetical protein PFISCL1PPCAC_29049, partial [Pristionchus fissidentatus]